MLCLVIIFEDRRRTLKALHCKFLLYPSCCYFFLTHDMNTKLIYYIFLLIQQLKCSDLDTCMGGLTLDSPLSDDGKSFKKTVSESSKKDDDVDTANDKVSNYVVSKPSATTLQLSCPSRATRGNDIICDRKRDQPSSWPSSSSKSLEELDFPLPTATDITRPPKQRRVSLTPRSMQHNTHDP